MITYEQVLQYARNGNNTPVTRVEKSLDEWRATLPPEVFHVTREQGTEVRESSNICHLYEPGIYVCTCCNTPLFDSNTKYDSKSG